nr:polyprenyl synthetase family protein [Antrihabitans stalactiti]
MSAGVVPISTEPTALTAAFEAALREFFESRRPTVDSIGGDFAVAVDHLEQFVLRGGKRIRPAFAWTGWLGAGGDPAGPDSPIVLRVCAALELIQACALIHDDIIDSSHTRRGRPTVHIAFADRHRGRAWSGDSTDFGDAVAILLGDLALSWADDMVRESALSQAATARLAPVWSAMRTEVLGGQFLDLHSEVTGDETVEAALQIDRYKTAAYTVERPLHIGAALADADLALIDAYRRFGADIGIAFQLRDDLLGVFGDPSVTGKPSGDDLREGKRTALFAVALQRADRDSPATASLLRSSIGTELDDEQVETIRAELHRLGAVDDIEARISALTERAIDTLFTSSATPVAKDLLRDMAVSATSRTS